MRIFYCMKSKYKDSIELNSLKDSAKRRDNLLETILTRWPSIHMSCISLSFDFN